MSDYIDEFARFGPLNLDHEELEKLEAECRLNDPTTTAHHKQTEATSRPHADVEADMTDDPPVPPKEVDTSDPTHDAVSPPDHDEPRLLHQGEPSADFALTGTDDENEPRWNR